MNGMKLPDGAMPSVHGVFGSLRSCIDVVAERTTPAEREAIAATFGVTVDQIKVASADESLTLGFVETVLNELAEWAWDTAEKAGFHEYNAERAQIEAAVERAKRCAEDGAPLPREVQDALLMMERKTRIPVPIPEKLLMIDGEIAEAMEAYRDPRFDPTKTYVKQGGEYVELADDDVDPTKKPEGLPIELADALIRGLHLAREANLNIGRAVVRKMLHNPTRSFRHGNKRA